jgi:sulfate permease, SulP family
MHAAPAGKPLPSWSAMRTLSDWFIAALLCLAMLLASGLLTAGPLGPGAIEMSVVGSFVAATVGGLVVAAIARAPAEIASPSASTTVIYASLAADLMGHGGELWQTWAAMSLAVVLMGAILLAAGLLRLAGFIKFTPSPVIAGLVTGIGLLLIWSQLGPIAGVQSAHGSTWSAWWAQAKPGSLVVGLVTIVAMVLVQRSKRLGQPALVALLAGTLTYYLLSKVLGSNGLGGTLKPLQPLGTAAHTVAGTWNVVTPGWVAATVLHVLPYAALLAMQAIMNAAMTAASVGNILGRRSDVNRTLVAQGCANIVCGVLGALPVSTTASLTLAAARMKGDLRKVAAGSAAVLFIFVLVAGRWLTVLPIAVLAALLVMSGVAMMNQSTVRLVKSAWSARSRNRSTLWTLGIAFVVAAALFWGSVPIALMTGAVLAMVLLSIELSAATSFSAQSTSHLRSRRAWPAQQANWLWLNEAKIAVFRPQGALFFGTADQLAQRLASTPAGTRFCVVDLSRVTTVDASACEIIGAGAKALNSSGITVLLAGVVADTDRGRNLVALGLSSPGPNGRWFADLDHALEHAEATLLAEEWPDCDTAACFDFAQTPLTQGMNDDDLQQLKASLRPVQVPAGPLFSLGDAASSMYIVQEGHIEIRIASGGPASHARLAALRPGSIFGEMSLLLARKRTADAVCLTPARLLELDRGSLDQLENTSPRVYAAVMRNLNVHVANRLDLATWLIRALQ